MSSDKSTFPVELMESAAGFSGSTMKNTAFISREELRNPVSYTHLTLPTSDLV